jgi:hypothetical protein
LIGPARDFPLWESIKPANIANANMQQIHDSGLAIYLEASEPGFSQRA